MKIFLLKKQKKSYQKLKKNKTLKETGGNVMPDYIYEYECPKCGNFEAIQNMTDKQYKEVKKMIDKQLETCPKCGNPCKCLIRKHNFDRLVWRMW